MADAKIAILLTLQHEGGYQNNPSDHANWSSGIIGVGRLVGTKYGITALDLPGADIEHLTPDDATAYYSKNYWKSNYSQISSQPIANKLFDLGVLMGVGTAVKALQFVLNLTADGVFGPVTLASLNAATPVTAVAEKVLDEFKQQLKEHAKQIAAENPTEAKFLGGWETRIDS